MNKLFIFGGILFLGMTSLDAREIGFRPRFNVGMMSYDFTQQAQVSSGEPIEGAAGAFPSATNQWSASVEPTILRSGFTLFVDRVFFDFDFQYALDESTKTSFSTWGSVPQEAFPELLSADQLMRFDTQADLDFERTEFAVTLGYSLTDQLALYAGYKRADNDTSFKLRGDVHAINANDLSENEALRGFSARLEQELDYQGPFLGATYTWNFNNSKLEGGLTGNVGVAFLNGRTNTSRQGLEDAKFSGDNGEIPVDLSAINSPPFNLGVLDGDTVGVSIALSWNGFTPIEGLMYSVGLNSYRYEFDDKNNSDFSIDILRLDAGFTYSFSL